MYPRGEKFESGKFHQEKNSNSNRIVLNLNIDVSYDVSLQAFLEKER